MASGGPGLVDLAWMIPGARRQSRSLSSGGIGWRPKFEAGVRGMQEHSAGDASAGDTSAGGAPRRHEALGPQGCTAAPRTGEGSLLGEGVLSILSQLLGHLHLSTVRLKEAVGEPQAAPILQRDRSTGAPLPELLGRYRVLEEID